MSKVALKYHFTFPDSRERTFELELDRDTAELTSPSNPSPPAWTELGFHQCTGCPFEKDKVSHCPAALHLSTVIDGFTDLVSYDKVRVEVETDERAVVATLSAQQALASLMGLIMASSGCESWANCPCASLQPMVVNPKIPTTIPIRAFWPSCLPISRSHFSWSTRTA